MTVIIMIATPGPVMMFVASAGLKGGYRKALQTIFGTNFASLILITVPILVLKGFLELSLNWFNAIKILGCLYIAYLGLQILKDVCFPKVDEDELSSQAKVLDGGFKQGFLVGISNPKDIIFSLVYLGFNRLCKSKIYSKLLGACGAILILVAGYGLYATLL